MDILTAHLSCGYLQMQTPGTAEASDLWASAWKYLCTADNGTFTWELLNRDRRGGNTGTNAAMKE